MKIPNKNFQENYYIDFLNDEIGEGGYGHVYKAKKRNENNKEVAVKIINKEKFEQSYEQNYNRKPNKEEIDKYIQDLFNEAYFMKLMEGDNKDNENTVKIIECFQDSKHIYIIMELCDENLLKFISSKNYCLNIKEIMELLSQLNNSFRIMSEKKIVHRDIKLPNILVKYKNKKKTEYIFKLTDYGVSKRLIDVSKLKTVVGTFTFMAPEILEGKEYVEKCDLWSLGIMIYKLLFRDFPFPFDEDPNEMGTLNIIKECEPKINTGNNNLDDLLQKLLIKDPNNRIGWEEYFNHPFFQVNKIVIKIEVTSNDKKGNEFNNIYFLDNVSRMEKMPLYKENEEIKRLVESNNECELYINGNKNKFNKYFKPRKEGIYIIEIYFNNKMKDCSFMFSGCKNIISVDLSSFNLSNVTSMYYMFGLCTHLKEINLSKINVENVTNMGYMFNKCIELEKIEFPESFNTKNVGNMEFMFHFCMFLEEIKFSSSFITNNVVNMKFMFSECNKIKMLDLSNFNTINVENMNSMFNKCNSLKTIKLNPNIFTTKKTKNMAFMFNKCYNLENINVSSFNTENVAYLDHMFCECNELSKLNLSNFKIFNNANLRNMFDDCIKLRDLDLSSFKIDDNNDTKDMFNNLNNIKIKVNKNYIENFKKINRDIESSFITN